MFNCQNFEKHLSTRQFGRPLHFFDTLSSTNSTLWNLVDQGAGTGTTVIAAQQRSGRGQWGRQWYSPLGGLYLSLAIVFKTCKAGIPINSPNLATESGQLTLSTAWGIANALRGHAIPVQIKWPNDLLLHGHKLGGILSETRSYQDQITTAVIGVGINWTNSVPEVGINLAALEPNPIRSLEMLAAIALEGLEAGYQRWQEGDLLPDYLELLTPSGTPGQGRRDTVADVELNFTSSGLANPLFSGAQSTVPPDQRVNPDPGRPTP